jgi:hypothetical protein
MKSPSFSLLGIKEIVPIIDSLVPLDPNLNRDESCAIRYESPDPNYLLSIGDTSVRSSYLNLRQGRGRSQPVLRVISHTDETQSFEWETFVPGEYFVYLLSNQDYWPLSVRGQLLLSKYGSSDQQELLLNVNVGSRSVILSGVKVAKALINAQIVNGFTYTYTITLQEPDISLYSQDSYIILSDPGTSPVRNIGGTDVSTGYVVLNVDETSYRKPLQRDPRKTFTLGLPATVTTCNVYISSDEEEWDNVQAGLRAGLFLVATSTDPSHDIFPVSLDGGQQLHADYVGRVTIKFIAEDSTITLQTGHTVSNLTIVDNPTGNLSILRGNLLYRSPETRIIGDTVVNSNHLTLSSNALSLRPPLSQDNHILFEKLQLGTLATGSYGIFTLKVDDNWNDLLPGGKGQAFLAKKPQISGGHHGGTPEDRWVESIAQITQNKSGHSDCVYGSKFYMFGGNNNFGTATKNISSFDFITRVFKTTGYTNCPVSRVDHKAVVWEDKMYCYGNYSVGSTQSLRLDIYNFSTNSWSLGTVPPDTEVRNDFSMTVWNGKIIISGGRSLVLDETVDDLLYKQVIIYDIVTDSWFYPAERAFTNRWANVSAVYDSKLYVWGGTIDSYGYGHDNSPCENLDVFDLVTYKWISSEPGFGRGYSLGVPFDLSNARSGCLSVVLDKDWYIMGGSSDNNFCDIYNFESKTWRYGLDFLSGVTQDPRITKVMPYSDKIYLQTGLHIDVLVLKNERRYFFPNLRTSDISEASHIGNVDLQFNTSSVLTSVTKDLDTDPRIGFDTQNSDFIIQTDVGQDTLYTLLAGQTYVRSPLHYEAGQVYRTNDLKSGTYGVYIANDTGWTGDFSEYRFEMFLLAYGESTATTLSFSEGRAAHYIGRVNIEVKIGCYGTVKFYMFPVVTVLDNPSGALAASRKNILTYTGTHPYGRAGATYLSTSLFYKPPVYLPCYSGTALSYDLRFSSGLPYTFDVYLSDLSSNWDLLDVDYRGCLFLVDEHVGDLGTRFEITPKTYVGFSKLGKISAKLQTITDSFANVSGVRFEDLVVLPGSDPYLVARNGQLYLDDTLPRNVSGTAVPTNYLDLEFRVKNYKYVLYYHDLHSSLGPVDFEDGDYSVYISSDQTEWDSFYPDYRSNLFLSRELTDIDGFLRFNMGAYSLVSKKVGRVTIALGSGFGTPNHHLVLKEGGNDFYYQDDWDSTLQIGIQPVDSSLLNFSFGKAKYKSSVDPGSVSKAATLLSSTVGEANVYLANNDLMWDQIGSSYRSSLFLSETDPDSSGILQVYYDAFGNFVEALRLGRVDVNWEIVEPTQLAYKQYRLRLVSAYNPRLEVTSDYDVTFKGKKKMDIDGTVVDASFMSLRSIYGRYRDPLVSYSSTVGLDVLTSGSYYVYLAPNDTTWGRYSGKIFLSTTVPIDGWFVCASLNKRAVAMGEVEAILDSLTQLPEKKYYFEIMPGSSECLLSLGDDVVYRTQHPYHGIPAPKGSYRLLSSHDFGIKNIDGSYRDCLDLSTSTPCAVALQPGIYNAYFASQDSIWQDSKLKLFLSATPPFRERAVFLADYFNNELGAAAWIGRVLVKSTPSWSIQYDEFMIGEIKEQYLHDLRLNYFGDLSFNDVELFRTLDNDTVITSYLFLDLTLGGLDKEVTEFVKIPLSEGEWNVFVSSGKANWDKVWEPGELFLSQLPHYHGKLVGTIDGDSVESLYVGRIYIKPWNKDLLASFQQWGAMDMTVADSDPFPLSRKIGGKYFKVGGTFFAYVRLPDGISRGYPISIRVTFRSDDGTLPDFYKFVKISFETRLVSSAIQDYQISSGCEDFSGEFGITKNEYYFLSDTIYGNRIDFTKTFMVSDEVGSIGMLQPESRDVLISKVSFHYNNTFDEQSSAVEVPGIAVDKVELIYR